MASTTHAGASAQAYGGVINEDVMQKIWDISKIPLPFTDSISSGTHSNRRTEWTEDELRAPVNDNAAIEAVDVNQNDSKLTVRLGNFTQISLKGIQLSDTLQAADSIGGVGTLAYQLKMRQQELRRDVEAQMLSHQASVAGDASAIAGISAGFGAQLKTNVKVGATGAVGGFNTTTGLFVAPTPGTPRALSETLIRDTLQDIYVAGGNTSYLMSTPTVIRALSTYMFGTAAKVATLTSDKAQKGNGDALTAYGSVNVFVTDFGQTVMFKDNRLQLEDAADEATMYLVDPSHITQSFLRGYQTEALAKTGLSDKRMMSVQYALKVYSEKSQGAILAIDTTAAVVA